MKMITIMVPTYNEEKNIQSVYERVSAVMQQQLPTYQYEIVFVDNNSNDKTCFLIEALSKRDDRVKAIFNARNFGYVRSHYYGLTQMYGDAVMLVHADLQNPPELIPEFVKKWENGAKVIIGVKDKSKENQIVFFMRSVYYKIMAKIGNVEQVEHFADFTLLDCQFVDVLREIKDPVPYLRGIICEFGFRMEQIHYEQDKRRKGKSSFSNFFDLYDFAMLGITSYSKALMRSATFVGAAIGFVSVIIGLSILVLKILHWNNYELGVAAIGTGVFFLGSLQLLFVGILGEYILSINSRVINRPLVIEERRVGQLYSRK